VKSHFARDLLNVTQKIARYSKSNFVQINKHSSGHAKRRQKWPPAAGDGRYATFLVSFFECTEKSHSSEFKLVFCKPQPELYFPA
jgi:hypothetical protein